MKLPGNWNPWNTIENLIVAIIVIVAMNFFVVKPLRADFRNAVAEIAAIAKQPKYSISNDFEKMKPRKGSDIIIDLDNTMDASVDTVPMAADSIMWTYEIIHEPFWKRWFGKNKNK